MADLDLDAIERSHTAIGREATLALVAAVRAALTVERCSPHEPHPGVPCIKCALSAALAPFGDDRG